MQRALTCEPQVAITANLAPQLCEGGFLIPERISIDACLFDLSTEFTQLENSGDGAELQSNSRSSGRLRLKAGTVFNLDLATAIKLAKRRLNNGHVTEFETGTIQVPSRPHGKFGMLLSTTVTVHKNFVVNEFDSGITFPEILNDFDISEFGSRIRFSYVPGPRPGFRRDVMV